MIDEEAILRDPSRRRGYWNEERYGLTPHAVFLERRQEVVPLRRDSVGRQIDRRTEERGHA